MDKRQHIVETAYRLFKRDGFHATGIDRIIAEADVAKMTMYRHFPGKDGLIAEVLNWRAARFAHQLDTLAHTGETAAEKIETILDWHERWFGSPDFHGCLFQNALAEFGDPAHPVFQAVMRQKHDLRRRIRDILAPAMPPQRAETGALVLFMLIEGATLLARMGEDKVALQSARSTAAAMFGVPQR